MTTVLEVLEKGTAYLEKHGVASARLNMQQLVAHVRGCGRMQLYLDFDRPLEESELVSLRDLMRQRVAGRPLQHLLGVVEFHGHEFLCDARALIPRPETEELVELLLRLGCKDDAPRILDMGCGSGVLGLSLAMAWRDKKPTLLLADCSDSALELARENAERMAEPLAGVVWQLVSSNLFAGVEETFDLLVANLPYVSEADYQEVTAEVRHDPREALVGGENGVELMVRFLHEAPEFTAPGGMVALEFGWGQGEGLKAEARGAGWTEVEIRHDFSGHDRFLLVR